MQLAHRSDESCRTIRCIYYLSRKAFHSREPVESIMRCVALRSTVHCTRNFKSVAYATIRQMEQLTEYRDKLVLPCVIGFSLPSASLPSSCNVKLVEDEATNTTLSTAAVGFRPNLLVDFDSNVWTYSIDSADQSRIGVVRSFVQPGLLEKLQSDSLYLLAWPPTASVWPVMNIAIPISSKLNNNCLLSVGSSPGQKRNSGPSREQLWKVKEEFERYVPTMLRSNMAYSLFDEHVVVEDRFGTRPRTRRGVSALGWTVAKYRLLVLARCVPMKVTVLRISVSEPHSRVTVRWRVVGQSYPEYFKNALFRRSSTKVTDARKDNNKRQTINYSDTIFSFSPVDPDST